jgi:hypothetical protein
VVEFIIRNLNVYFWSEGWKGDIIPVLKYHVMETYKGNDLRAPRILNLSARWRCVASFTIWPHNLHGKNSFMDKASVILTFSVNVLTVTDIIIYIKNGLIFRAVIAQSV